MQTLLTVKSITYAQKGQQFLEKNWIHSSVVPTPEMISKRGCSYALLVRGDADRAAKLLEQVKGVLRVRIVKETDEWAGSIF